MREHDEARPQVQDDSAAKLGAEAIEDPALRDEVAGYRKALGQKAAAIRKLDAFMKSPGYRMGRFDAARNAAITKELQGAERARAGAAKAIDAVCEPSRPDAPSRAAGPASP